jgi:hypothetical protein
MLSACGSASPSYDEMTSSSWANAPGPCGKQFTTFGDRTIRWHYADGSVDFGKIVKIGEASPGEVMLTVEPSDAIKAAAHNRHAKPLPDAVTMGFQLNGDHLRLRAIVGGDHGEIGGMLKPSDMEYRLFDLVKCQA